MLIKANFSGRPDDFDMEKSFDATFKGLEVSDDAFGGKSVEYYNPMSRKSTKALFEKALLVADSVQKSWVQKASISTGTGGAGTAGNALIPVYPDSNIVDRTIRETPLRNIFARRAIKGDRYDYIPKTTQGAAVWAAEGASINDQLDVYDRVSVPVKYGYAKGRITGPSIAAMRGFIDPTQLDLASKTKAMRELEEETIINGNATTDPNEFNGLIQTISTNTTNLSGGYVTLPLIRAEFTTVVNANGFPELAVTDAATHNYVKGLLMEFQRNVENPSRDRLGFGIPGAFQFDDTMFIWDRFMPTGASSKRMLFLDLRYIFMGVLQDLTYEEKYSENDDYPYLLKMYETLVVTFEAACSQIYGIA